MKLSNFLQAFGLIALMACVALVTQSLTVDSIQKENQITGDQPYIGEIAMFAGNFAPRGWALCNGQILSIQQNTALFSLIGTIYGGDGRTTFALPDLRGRAPVHAGQGPGLTNHRLGQKGGQEEVTLNQTQLPSHNHFIQSDLMVQEMQIPRAEGEGEPIRIPVADGEGESLNLTVSHSGGNRPVNNKQPYLTINYIISLQGTFPSRN